MRNDGNGYKTFRRKPLMLVTFGFGILFVFPTRVLCIVDAALYKPRSSSPLGKLVIAGLCINGGGLLLAIIMWAGAIGSTGM